MPVLSKLKRLLCCGISEKEMESPYERKVVKKHLRRGLVPPPAVAFRRQRSNSCPVKFDFASISIELTSPKGNDFRASGDNSDINEAESQGVERQNDNEVPDCFVPLINGNKGLIKEIHKVSEAEENSVDCPSTTDLADDDTEMITENNEHIDVKNECAPMVESESTEVNQKKTLLKEKIAAFSSLGFGRSALYCRPTTKYPITTRRVGNSDLDDGEEEEQRIWGKTRRPRSVGRNREDSPWLQARARTPASRIGRNYRPIYHALQQATEARQTRRVKNADWLSARQVLKQANTKRNFRLTKKMRHCRLAFRKTDVFPLGGNH